MGNDLFQEIETFKEPSAWLKMKTEIDKKRLSKSVTQIKNKLRNMKDAYKRQKIMTGQLELHLCTHHFTKTSKKCWDPEV